MRNNIVEHERLFTATRATRYTPVFDAHKDCLDVIVAAMKMDALYHREAARKVMVACQDFASAIMANVPDSSSKTIALESVLYAWLELSETVVSRNVHQLEMARDALRKARMFSMDAILTCNEQDLP